jgi:hypothetical protein
MKLNKKNIIFLLFFISLLSLNSIATQPELTFNLHTTFVEEISYIKVKRIKRKNKDSS